MIASVLSQFGLTQPHQSADLGNAGGFSGSHLWKIITPGDVFCLKRWPSNFCDEGRLAWIHDVLAFSKVNGCEEVVVPLPAPDGKRYVFADRHFWELMKWENGQPALNFECRVELLSAAVKTLARFHQSTARYQLAFQPSKKLTQTVQTLKKFPLSFSQAMQTSNELYSSLRPVISQSLRDSIGNMAIEIADSLAKFATIPLPVQPVIRDARADHFLFEHNKLSAIIDFGAMQIDSVACDLARLAADVTGSRAKFDLIAKIYANYRPLLDHEFDAAKLLKRAVPIVSLYNWTQWLTVENRHFDDPERVKSRVLQIVNQLVTDSSAANF